MKMVSGHIASSTNLGNGVVLVHRITNLRQKLAAMGVKGAIPATVVDDQIVAVADMIPCFNDRAGLHCKNRRTVGIGNIQTIVDGGILPGIPTSSRLPKKEVMCCSQFGSLNGLPNPPLGAGELSSISESLICPRIEMPSRSSISWR